MANSIAYQNVMKRLAELKFRANEKSGECCHLSKSVGGTWSDFLWFYLDKKKMPPYCSHKF